VRFRTLAPSDPVSVIALALLPSWFSKLANLILDHGLRRLVSFDGHHSKSIVATGDSRGVDPYTYL
jgi:hypothetical protein